jgi:hypothetical protein
MNPKVSQSDLRPSHPNHPPKVTPVRGSLGGRDWETQSDGGNGSGLGKGQKASDLLIAAFDAKAVYVERKGTVTRGAKPDWLDWPMVRGDEFAPQSPATPKAKR